MGKITRNIGTFTFAVLVHIAFVVMLVFSFDWNTAPEKAQSNVVNAVFVNEKRPTQPESRKPPAAPAPDPAPQQEPEKTPKPDIEKQKKIEEQRKAEEQRNVEEQQRKEEVVQQKNLEAEQLSAAKLKKEQEKKQQEEQTRVEEQKRLADAEAKRKIEEQQRKQREEDEKRRREDEEALKQQMAAEEGARDQMTDRQRNSLLQQWKSAIEQKVKRSWRKPEGSQPGLKCDVRVQQIPGGDVINVTITACNNSDAAFQRSIEAAVIKASPLPPPPDPSIFDRDIVITFKPE